MEEIETKKASILLQDATGRTVTHIFLLHGDEGKGRRHTAFYQCGTAQAANRLVKALSK